MEKAKHNTTLLFQRRPLTTIEADILVEGIREEPNITGYSKSEWMGGKDVFLLYDPGRQTVAAALLVHHLLGNWSEIAVIYVRPEYRGQSLSESLLDQTVETIKFSRRSYIIFYSTPRMERMLVNCGFRLFKEQRDFESQKRRWRIYFRLMYKPQWLLNIYRVRELLRKQKQYTKTFDFSVGVFNVQN